MTRADGELVVVAAPVEYSMAHPVVTSAGTIRSRRGWVVAVSTRDDLETVGRGEVLPLPGWATAPIDRTAAAIEAAVANGISTDGAIDTGVAEVDAGLDAARWNLRSAMAGQPLWHTLGASSAVVEVNELVGGGSVADLEASIARVLVGGATTVKVKMGFADDGERIRAVATAASAHPSLRVRLDPNGAWAVPDAVRLCALASERLGPSLEYIEDPVATLADLEKLAPSVAAGIAADDLFAQAARAGAAPAIDRLAALVDVVVIKPPLFGGIDAVMALGELLADSGVDVVISSTYDGPDGLRAWCSLAAALEPVRAHGLGTGGLIDHPAMHSLVPRRGRIDLSGGGSVDPTP